MWLLEKFKKVNDEMIKYRVFKAIKVNAETAANSRQIYETLWSNHLSKCNSNFVQSVFIAWRQVSSRSAAKKNNKLDCLGERNYYKLAQQVFSAWNKTIKQQKILRNARLNLGNELSVLQDLFWVRKTYFDICYKL